MEGGLGAPVRNPHGFDQQDYLDEAKFELEARRVFDICHGCRRCFNLCASFPRLFDLVDSGETGEVDGVVASDFGEVMDACTLCDMCFMVTCPYVPPHEFNLDFPHLVVRYRAIQNSKGSGSFVDRELAKTDRNARFATPRVQAPRRFDYGQDGQQQLIKLELKLLADVGLVGLPNAGKSTLVRALSAARPKVADYPFTTLHPSLGVVSIEADRSFVVADIPGLIEGAAEGAGLGIRFLRHLQRTRLLVHVVDVGGGTEDPVEAIRSIESELERYSDSLSKQTRWLAFNKLDLLPRTEWKSKVDSVVQALGWSGPAYGISAVTGEGTDEMAREIMSYLEAQAETT